MIHIIQKEAMPFAMRIGRSALFRGIALGGCMLFLSMMLVLLEELQDSGRTLLELFAEQTGYDPYRAAKLFEEIE